MENDPKKDNINASTKEAYEAPKIVYREPLEAVAVVCNPGKGTPAVCPAGPINS